MSLLTLIPKKTLGSNQKNITDFFSMVRKLFYYQFIKKMNRHVRLFNYANLGRDVACWRDAHGGFNHIRISNHLIPTNKDPHAPIIFRIHINSAWLPNCKGINSQLNSDYDLPKLWRSEVTVLFSEMHDFASWIARLLKISESSKKKLIPKPLHDCYVGSPGYPESNYIWSVKGWKAYDKHKCLEHRVPLYISLRKKANKRAGNRRRLCS